MALCLYHVASCGLAAETDLEALFLNTKEGKVLCLALNELGRRQPPTPMHCGNNKAARIENYSAKKQRPRSMEMQLCWVPD